MERDRLFMAVMFALVIFLCVLLLFAVAGDGPATGEQWSFSANDTLREGNMFVGDDGTFYTASGHTIYAIAPDGSTRWSLDPGFASWYDSHYRNLRIQAAAFGNGNTYMIVIPSDRNNTLSADGKLLAISPEGSVAWSRDEEFLKGGSLAAVDGRLVVFHNYNLSVFNSRDGTLLWNMANVDSPVVDFAGRLCCIKDLGENHMINGPMAVASYDFEGRQLWSRPLSELGADRLAFDSSLMFLNDTLYVPYYNGNMAGIIALDGDGDLKWRQDVVDWNGIFATDPDGSVYYCIRYGEVPPKSWMSPAIVVLQPDGHRTTVAGPELADSLGTLLAISNGTAYYCKTDDGAGDRKLADIDNYTVSGYDLGTGTVTWQAKAGFKPKTVTVDDSNVRSILYRGDMVMRPYIGTSYSSPDKPSIGDLFMTDWPDNLPKGRNVQSGVLDPWDYTPRVVNRSSIGITVANGVLLADTWAYNFEYPGIYNNSICAYAGGIYAFDAGDGRTLWSRETDSYVTSMAAKNGTIVYRTGDGRFSSTTVSLAAGFAAAAFYLFFRFFMLGAVSRARSRLDQNRNRNAILGFITGNPGATLYEIARALEINLGTVRYHLLVLSLNHKVISDKHGPKSVGYFVNGRRYSEEERLVLSLARREQIRALLGILSGRPGMANGDIAAEMRLPDSSISRYLAELCEKGIVEKRKSDGGKLNYFIVERYAPVVAGVCPAGYAASEIRPCTRPRCSGYEIK